MHPRPGSTPTPSGCARRGAEAIAEAGLPADLVSVETSVWKRLTPGRNPWPQVAEFDARVAA